jgi:hypothetical protein
LLFNEQEMQPALPISDGTRTSASRTVSSKNLSKITVRLEISVTHGAPESEQRRAEQYSRDINA